MSTYLGSSSQKTYHKLCNLKWTVLVSFLCTDLGPSWYLRSYECLVCYLVLQPHARLQLCYCSFLNSHYDIAGLLNYSITLAEDMHILRRAQHIRTSKIRNSVFTRQETYAQHTNTFNASCVMSLKPHNLRKLGATFYIIILYYFCMDTSHINK